MKICKELTVHILAEWNEKVLDLKIVLEKSKKVLADKKIIHFPFVQENVK